MSKVEDEGEAELTVDGLRLQSALASKIHLRSVGHEIMARSRPHVVPQFGLGLGPPESGTEALNLDAADEHLRNDAQEQHVGVGIAPGSASATRHPRLEDVNPPEIR